MGQSRNKTYNPKVVGIYHCWSQCAQQEFLLGLQSELGGSRKDVVELRTRFLAAIFAIEVLEFCVMDSHIHHVLRNRPDLAKQWSREDVARRWWQLHPTRRNEDGSPAEMTAADLKKLMKRKRNRKLRKRLGNISWFMKELKEFLSKGFNAEKGKKGAFWAGRFKMTRLEDEGAVLAASVYVALNEIRAGMVDRPEESRYSSVWRRIQALRERSGRPWRATAAEQQVRREVAEAAAETGEFAEVTDGQAKEADGELADAAGASELPLRELLGELASSDAWLSPVSEEGEPGNETAPQYRASNKGYLPMTVEKFLQILDWTGRQQRLDKPGVIPDWLPPILERIGVNSQTWLETINAFDDLTFVPRVLAAPETMARLIADAGQKWFKGLGFVRQAYL